MKRFVSDHRNALRFLFPILALVALAAATRAVSPAVAAAPPAESDHGAQRAAQAATTTVFLVRHAEKAAPGDPEFVAARPNDPPLNAAGRARAEELVRTLSEAGVTAIYSSSYERTRATVRPLAARLGLEVAEHEAADVAGLAERIGAENRGGVVVVAGHSNTVPALVEALGADPVAPIEEAWEYDNLYVVTIEAAGRSRASTLKYGSPSGPRNDS